MPGPIPGLGPLADQVVSTIAREQGQGSSITPAQQLVQTNSLARNREQLISALQPWQQGFVNPGQPGNPPGPYPPTKPPRPPTYPAPAQPIAPYQTQAQRRINGGLAARPTGPIDYPSPYYNVR